MSTDRRDAEPEPETERMLVDDDSRPSASTPNKSTVYRARMKYLRAEIERMKNIVEAAEGAGEQVMEQPTVQLPPEVGRRGKIKELRGQAEALVEKINSMVMADEQEAHGGEGFETDGGGEAEARGGGGVEERGGGGVEERGGGGAEPRGAGEPEAYERNKDDEDEWQDDDSDLDYIPSGGSSDSSDSTSIGESESVSDSSESAKDLQAEPGPEPESEPASGRFGTLLFDQRVKRHWPRLRRAEKIVVLDQGIAELKRRLRLKKGRPEGQHLENHAAVLTFMLMQRVVLAGARRTPRPRFRFTAIQMASGRPPNRKDLALFVAMGKGHTSRVQRRILRDEKSWIKEQVIPVPMQGKTSRLQSILEDEGVQLAVREYTAQAGDKISAEDMRKVVERYLQDPDNAFEEEDGRILSRTVQEMERIDTENVRRRDDARRDNDSIDTQQIGRTRVQVRFRKVKKGLCVRTMERWLHWMGYSWKEVRKGIYKDGHEREDVVRDRQERFLPFMASVEPRLAKWNAELERLPLEIGSLMAHQMRSFASLPPEHQLQTMILLKETPTAVPCPLVPVIHDECTYNANDGVHHQWILGDHNPLRKKSRGAALMVSEFLTPTGRLKLPPDCTQEEMDRLRILDSTATEILQCGGDKWWNQEYLIEQIITKAIPIFNRAFPGQQALFIFDNATIHSAFAKDALRVTKLNIGPGGEQPFMRPGWYWSFDPATRTRVKVKQDMQFSKTHPNPYLRGKQKGTRQILRERGLWPTKGLILDCKKRTSVPKEQRQCKGTDRSPCCTKWLLARQPDFLEQKPRVQEAIENLGHLCTFLPKFHPEMSWIEYFWGQSKRYHREKKMRALRALRA
jgi:hypothetical protein